MITFKEFDKFSKENKEKVIDMIFGVNIPSELERIKKSIEEEGEKSEFVPILLENISFVQGNQWIGKYYDVKGLVYMSPKEMGVNPETEDHDD